MAVSVKIDDALKDRVQHLASARQRTPHWIMREAIARYVDQEEARETVKADAIAAWESYQQTGLHATFEEADAWLAKLERGEVAAPPEVHR